MTLTVYIETPSAIVIRNYVAMLRIRILSKTRFFVGFSQYRSALVYPSVIKQFSFIVNRENRHWPVISIVNIYTYICIYIF